ncbi:hypothetical protein N9N28_06895 [Rubripirellula amarantea]|nr:hypothetical protein [Rubripirellula amarantea]
MNNNFKSVQFYGGPLDGYSATVPTEPYPIVTFETMIGKKQRPRSLFSQVRSWLGMECKEDVLTVVATYRIDRRRGNKGYIHVGSSTMYVRQTSSDTCHRMSRV